MKTNNLLPLVLVLAGVFFASSLPAQEITSNAAYRARMDSLSERPCNLRRKLKPIPKSRIPFLP